MNNKKKKKISEGVKDGGKDRRREGRERERNMNCVSHK
jgi:hypothetical protein